MSVSENKKSLVMDSTDSRWIPLFFYTLLACTAYVTLEWVFIVTKPSFLDEAGWLAKFLVLLQSFLLLSGVVLGVLFILFLLTFKLSPGKQAAAIRIAVILPALILAGLGLLMIDNFTYTVFKFGITTTQGILRGVYGVLFLVMAVYFYRSLVRLIFHGTGAARWMLITVGLAGVGFVVVLLGLNRNVSGAATGLNSITQRPNILLIGSDGLNASHMSVYGYERETTPNIEAFAREALMVENNFPNSSNTSGSIISIFTGKYPTQTRVLYPPDILRGVDAYQHLPGLLKRWGYYNVELAEPHFADAYTLGVLQGFDEVNGRSANRNPYFELMEAGFTNNVAYFLSTLYERIANRVLHIFYIRKMVNPFDLITKSSEALGDEEKAAEISRLFKKHTDQPLFIHAHLMGTHGRRTNQNVRKFAPQSGPEASWTMDHYDDSIYNFDLLFKKVLKELDRQGLLDETIVILYSDHGLDWQSNQKVPLIIRFPGGEYGGEKVGFGQNLNIAPTILEYLGSEQPDWMVGESVLETRDEIIPVISTGASNTENAGAGWVQNQLYNNPPFYQFDFIQVIYCQNWRRLDLETYEWSSGEVDAYSEPCLEKDLLSFNAVQKVIADRLRADGFVFPTDLVGDYIP